MKKFITAAAMALAVSSASAEKVTAERIVECTSVLNAVDMSNFVAGKITEDQFVDGYVMQTLSSVYLGKVSGITAEELDAQQAYGQEIRNYYLERHANVSFTVEDYDNLQLCTNLLYGVYAKTTSLFDNEKQMKTHFRIMAKDSAVQIKAAMAE